MPPSDPACPTCGTQVRANDYWSYLAGPSSPRVYYPKSIMDDNPEIAGTFTRCADPFHAAPSDPAAVPPPDEHERDVREIAEDDRKARMAERVKAWLNDPERWAGYQEAADASRAEMEKVPPPPPEWAVDIALEEFDKDRIDLGFVDPLARLLASVREGAIRQARDTVAKMPCEFDDGDNVVVMRDAAVNAVDALLHTPPSGGGA